MMWEVAKKNSYEDSEPALSLSHLSVYSPLLCFLFSGHDQSTESERRWVVSMVCDKWLAFALH
jgi:hypothetical protein